MDTSNSTPWYVSSSGNGLSATVFGFSVMGIAQAASMLLTMVGHPVDSNLVEQIITGVVAVVGAVLTVVGLVRKAANKVTPA
jgi:hypothetical protein